MMSTDCINGADNTMDFLIYLIGFCADCAIAAALAIAFIRRDNRIVVRRS